jgi:hypothetical protein
MRIAPVLLALFLAAPAPAQIVVDGAGVVSDAEVAAFLAADADGDRFLTLAEFRVFIRHMAEAGQPTAQLVRRIGAYRIAFRRVDADGDGRATPGELRRGDEGFRAEQ